MRDEIKSKMLSRDTEELTAGPYTVRRTPVLNQRFDSTAFKKVMPEVYKVYAKQVSCRRYTVSAGKKPSSFGRLSPAVFGYSSSPFLLNNISGFLFNFFKIIDIAPFRLYNTIYIVRSPDIFR